MGDRPHVELFGALQSLYQSRDYADYTIVTNDGACHRVHRAIICPRSRYFTEAVKTSHPSEISLSDEPPDIVGLMIEYFYQMEYTPQTASLAHRPSSTSSDRTDAATYGNVYGSAAVSAFGGPRGSAELQHYGSVFSSSHDRSASSLTVHALPGLDISTFSGPAPRRSAASRSSRAPSVSPLAAREPQLRLHAMVYAAGEKYGIAGLKALALDKFKIQLTKHWDSTELAEAIHVVYSSTPAADKDMRDAVADALGWHGQLLDKPEIEVAIMEINGLAYELLKRTRRAEPEYG